LDRVLSKNVVSARVAARAAERNSWPEFDGFPTASAFFQYTCTKLCDLIAFHRRHVPADLDDDFPLHQVDWDALRKPPSSLQVTWLGHASILIQIEGCSILADPIFSQCCAPTQHAGPERYRPPEFTVDEMVKENIHLDGILISHNHYDHLDYQSVLDLAKAYPEKREDLLSVCFHVDFYTSKTQTFTWANFERAICVVHGPLGPNCYIYRIQALLMLFLTVFFASRSSYYHETYRQMCQ
jgi:hypothetical protein